LQELEVSLLIKYLTVKTIEMKVKITQVRSRIGRHWRQKRTLDALGLKKMHRSVEHNLTPQIQGMINAVSHLVVVEELKQV
jgi:large subunit ribosomal protein L30